MSFKIIRNMIVGLLISILVGTALIISVYMLPVDGIRAHVKNSMHLISRTGDRLGGIANDLSLLIASSKKSSSVINDAMMNPRMNYNKSQLENLQLSLEDENSEQGEVMNYSRYWHGYLIYLKPLLMFTSFLGVVEVSFLLQFFLFVLLTFKIYEKLGKIYSWAFALVIFIWHPITFVFCHELACVYYITLITILIMLSKNEKFNEGGNYYYLFMFNGILVAYFDFLTYPLAALGLPTIFYLLLNENKFTLIKKFFNMIKFALSWSFGYVGMWVGKWCMATMLTDYNTIADALEQVLWRLNGDYHEAAGHTLVAPPSQISWYAPILRNLQVIKAPLILLCLFLILVILYFVLVKKWQIKFDKNKIIPLFFVFLYPFIWYIVVNNHSTLHIWVTYRLLAISIFAAFCIAVKSILPPTEKGD